MYSTVHTVLYLHRCTRSRQSIVPGCSRDQPHSPQSHLRGRFSSFPSHRPYFGTSVSWLQSLTLNALSPRIDSSAFRYSIMIHESPPLNRLIPSVPFRPTSLHLAKLARFKKNLHRRPARTLRAIGQRRTWIIFLVGAILTSQQIPDRHPDLTSPPTVAIVRSDTTSPPQRDFDSLFTQARARLSEGRPDFSDHVTWRTAHQFSRAITWALSAGLSAPSTATTVGVSFAGSAEADGGCHRLYQIPVLSCDVSCSSALCRGASACAFAFGQPLWLCYHWPGTLKLWTELCHERLG